MRFNKHTELEGKHAFLSPSGYTWINYDEEKLEKRFTAAMASRRGTELHDFAKEAIRLGIKLPTNKKTLNMYVNDAIGFKMEPEQTLYFSENCFGHADAISFRQMFLRIHDLKTGSTATSEHQLEVYDALFCLEYGFSPFDIEHELRIYQNNQVMVFIPDPDKIAHIMDKIVTFDHRLEVIKGEL